MKYEEMKMKMINNLEDMMYDSIYIHAGRQRKVVSKVWEKGDKKREYFEIRCYSYAWNFKGAYKCGYIDLVTGEYVTTKYDEVDAMKKEYIGR